MLNRLRRWRRELDELREELEDPQVTDIPSGGGEFVVERLHATRIGNVFVQGSRAGLHVIAFSSDGWARRRYWTRRWDKDSLASALAVIGIPEDEAAEMASELAPAIEARPPQH